MNGFLLLEDGTVFEGIAEGKSGEQSGEIVLNTAVVGYQENMTDPTNAGKILVLTYPLIGNCGVAGKFNESEKPLIHGIVFRERSKIRSNWEAEESFESFLTDQAVIALSEVDTRTLAVRIRDHGEMFGLISTNGRRPKESLDRLRELKKIAKTDYVKHVSVKDKTRLDASGTGPSIGVLDLGMLRSFSRQFLALGCSVTLLPHDTAATDILAGGFDGIVISNGPEGDEAVPRVVDQVRQLIGKTPLLGIALGHEIIGLALGGELEKMKVGHHGVNYPVRAADSFKGRITTQNHSLVVNEKSLSHRDDIEITLRNVNDETVEEMKSDSLNILSAQYYPVSPAPGEVHDVFHRFLNLISEAKRS